MPGQPRDLRGRKERGRWTHNRKRNPNKSTDTAHDVLPHRAPRLILSGDGGGALAGPAPRPQPSVDPRQQRAHQDARGAPRRQVRRRPRSSARSSSSPVRGAPRRAALRPPPPPVTDKSAAVGLDGLSAVDDAPHWSMLSLRAGVSAPASHGVGDVSVSAPVGAYMPN